MSNNERVNQWQSIINQQKESVLSGAKFCKRAGLDSILLFEQKFLKRR